MQQLDKNMNHLRTWLARVEAELAEPPAYQVCHADEIQRQLAQQQVRFQPRPRAHANEQMLTSRVDRFRSGRGPAQSPLEPSQTSYHRVPVALLEAGPFSQVRSLPAD